MQKENDDIYQTGLTLFERAKNNESENRQRYVEDFRFIVAGEQWSETVENARREAQRPCQTNNILKPILRQEQNKARKSRPSIRVTPSDMKSDPALARVFEDLIRHIEYASSADIAYDTAAESALAGGVGYIRVSVDYPTNDAFDMDVIIEPVMDPLNVYVPSKKLSYNGAEWNDVFYVFSADKSTYPDSDSFNADVANAESDEIILCEWFHRESTTELTHRLSTGETITDSAYQHDIEYYTAVGSTIKQSREMTSYVVKNYILDGKGIVAEREFPGEFIPIVPVYGEIYMLDGKLVIKGLLSDAKDAQRSHNIARSSVAEISSLSPRVPYIVGEGAVVNPRAWGKANDPSTTFLEYDFTASGGQPPIPFARDMTATSVQQLAIDYQNDIYNLTGTKPPSADSSGESTSFVTKKLSDDIGVFHFIDNLTRSLTQVGKVLLSVIPFVYEPDRIVKIMGEDGSTNMITLPSLSGKYDVQVKPGDNYLGKREQAKAELSGMIQFAPDAVREYASDILVELMDIDDSYKRRIVDKMSKPAVDPNAPVANAGPTADQQILMDKNKNEANRLEYDMAKLQLENKKVDNDFVLRKAELQIKDDAQTLAEHKTGAHIASTLFNDELKYKRGKPL